MKIFISDILYFTSKGFYISRVIQRILNRGAKGAPELHDLKAESQLRSYISAYKKLEKQNI